jgi:CRP-like cAMP-binding protein
MISTELSTNSNNFIKEIQNYIGLYAKYQILEKDAFVLDSDKTLKNFFIILSGKIKVSKIDFESGREQILYILSKGDMYDLIPLLDNNINENVVKTLEETHILSIPLNKAKELFQSNPEINSYLLKYIAKQLRHLESSIENISLYDTKTRLINLLIDYLNDKTGQIELIKGISHEDLASIIGTVRKVINRDINELKRVGIIDVKRKEIIITDYNKLLSSKPI